MSNSAQANLPSLQAIEHSEYANFPTSLAPFHGTESTPRTSTEEASRRRKPTKNVNRRVNGNGSAENSANRSGATLGAMDYSVGEEYQGMADRAESLRVVDTSKEEKDVPEEVASHVLRNQKLRDEEKFWRIRFEEHLFETNWSHEAKQSPANRKKSGLVHEKGAVYEATYDLLMIGHAFISAVCKPGMARKLGMLPGRTTEVQRKLLMRHFLLDSVKPLFLATWRA